MIPLRDIRRQILSIRRISHITQAMKTVSAIRLMKVQQQVLRQKPYAEKLRQMIAELLARTGGEVTSLLLPAGRNQHPDRELISSAVNSGWVQLLVLGSDRGMCGPFNHNLAVKTSQVIDRLRTSADSAARLRDIRLVVVGKRLRDLLRSRRLPIAQEMIGFWSDLRPEKVRRLVDEYLAEYLAGRISELRVVYTQFKSSAQQLPAEERILPLREETLPSAVLYPEYTYEPDARTILDYLLPMFYQRELWRVFLESVASEQMARMRAMDMASVNARELIRELTLKLNKARQEIITRELAEIASAAEVLRSG